MEKEGCKLEVIKFVESSSDEDTLKVAVFIAGMRAQKSINISTFNSEKSNKHSFRCSTL